MKYIFIVALMVASFYAYGKDSKNSLSTENIGDVEGYVMGEQGLSNVHIGETTYQARMSHPISLGVFDSERPLPIKLSGSGSSKCSSYYLDKNFSIEQTGIFFDEYEGSRIRLSDVQAVKMIGGGGSVIWCKFTEYKVLATKDSLDDERKKKIEKQKSYKFDGHIKANVHRIIREDMRLGKLVEGEITAEQFYQHCQGRAKIDPSLDFREYRGKRGVAAIDLKISDGKCVAKKLTFDSN